MKESSRTLALLPPWLLLVAGAVVPAAPAHTQERYRATRTENFRAEPDPNGPLLATVQEGGELAGGSRRGGWVEITLEGWIWARSVDRSDRDGFDLRVGGAGENLRAEPNGRVVARLRSGALLDEVTRREGWVQVRRRGWMWRESLTPLVVSSSAPGDASNGQTPDPGRAAPAAERPAPGSQQPSLDRALTMARTAVLQTPDGDTAGVLAPRTPTRVLARSGEWVRVQFDGWVRETDLRPAGDGVLLGVTGTEVRSRPEDFEGQVLQWTLQLLALQTADELRREMPRGTRYLLVRGPLPEAGFVYVMLTAEQAARLADVPPLQELTVVGRVRVARSRYVGNPILELIDVAAAHP